LDFGHWSAHKLETLSDYRISHGAAVAAGIALDAYYAMKKRLITSIELSRILTAITDSGLKVWYPEMEIKRATDELAILEGLHEFQEHLGGQLTITLPDSIGQKIEVHHMDVDCIEEGIFYLRNYADDKGAISGMTAG